MLTLLLKNLSEYKSFYGLKFSVENRFCLLKIFPNFLLFVFYDFTPLSFCTICITDK